MRYLWVENYTADGPLPGQTLDYMNQDEAALLSLWPLLVIMMTKVSYQSLLTILEKSFFTVVISIFIFFPGKPIIK